MNRLARRVTLIFFLAIAALLIVLAASFAFILYQSQRASTAALQNETAESAALAIGAHMDSLHAPLVDATRLRPDLLQDTQAEQQNLLNDLLAQNSAYLELALLDDKGNVSTSTARPGHHVVGVEHDAEIARASQAAQQGHSYLGHVYLTASTQEPYIVMGEPYASPRGALVAWINLKHIWDIVSEVRVGDSGYAYVLDLDGNLIAYRDPALILAGQNPLNAIPGLRAHVSAATAAEYTGLNGAADIGAHAPIASTHWVVVVETPLAEAYALLYRTLALTAVLLVIAIAISALLARYLANRLLDAVELLREGAALIGQGHLDHRIVIDTGDEIEDLAAEFNRMTQSLRRARAELEGWAHEMERRVQERTEQVVEQRQRLAVLEERQRVARELHDSISQALFTVTITLESAQQFLLKDAARMPVLLERAHGVAKEALGDVRTLISELRPVPLEQHGLPDALREQFAAITTRTGIPVGIHTDMVDKLPSEREEALYRIALEAVNNAVKHAHATRISVYLVRRDDRVELKVTDDGTGFDTRTEHPGHYGLGTMRERAQALGGTTKIESSPGTGTTVEAEIPVGESNESRG